MKIIPFNQTSSKFEKKPINPIVGPGRYTQENSLDKPLIIKNTSTRGSYFIYREGKI